MWSDQRETERQVAVGRWLDIAVEKADWDEQSLARYHWLRELGSLSEAIMALIEACDARPRATEFWESVQKAAELLWLVHPWTPSKEEGRLRIEYLSGLENRIKGWDH